MKIGKTHEEIKKFKDLIKSNKTQNLIICDDISILEIALKNKIDIITLLYCDDISYKPETDKLLQELIKHSQISYQISYNTYQSLAFKENSVGIIACLKTSNYSLNELKDMNFIVVCDSLEIPGNLGTIYRTMESAKVDAFINVDSKTKLTNPKVTSSARGANLLIPTCNTNYQEALKWLLDNNYTIFLGEPKLGKDYQYYDYQGKIAIVVGNERFGINNDWYNHPHQKVFIPMFGNNNSLNVGVAASILIYEAMMKRR